MLAQSSSVLQACRSSSDAAAANDARMSVIMVENFIVGFLERVLRTLCVRVCVYVWECGRC